MPTLLVIAGLVVTAIGILLILLARFERPPAGAQESIDIAGILEQFNALLKLVEARYRIAAGLALVGLGAWLEAKDAKDAAEQAVRVARLLA
jgi:uncharacterized membrane protein